MEHPEKFSEAFNKFIALCLVKKPEERMTASELLDTEFIKSAQSEVILEGMVNEAIDLISDGALFRENEEAVSLYIYILIFCLFVFLEYKYK